MKVILLQDVAKIGRKGSIVDVPNGYAMNQLIPAKKATPATGANLKKATQAATATEAAAVDTATKFTKNHELLSAEPLVITATMNDQGHLFEAVSAEAVVTAAAERGATITPEMVAFSGPIKSEGEHQVTLEAGSHQGQFIVKIDKA